VWAQGKAVSSSTDIKFEQFLTVLNEIAESEGYQLQPGGMNAFERGYWRNLFDQGLTPQQAWKVGT
jgi:hypothetical protein